MTTLRQLLGSVVPATHPLASREVKGLQYDSRNLRADEVFFAFPGERVDGHQFVEPALAAGTLAVVSEREAPDKFVNQWIRVPHGRQALAPQPVWARVLRQENSVQDNVFIHVRFIQRKGEPQCRIAENSSRRACMPRRSS